MPELPEVETTVRYLRPQIRGKRILGVWSNTPRLFRDRENIGGVRKKILGRRILGLERIGKNVCLCLAGGYDLLIHLMMSGKLLLQGFLPKEKHVRFWMKFDDGGFLVLHDVRKFGRIRLTSRSPTSRGKSDFPKLNLGPDALSLNFEMFKSTFRQHRGIVKNVLLNQKILSGIGNIYSDEILWYAGIGPKRKTDSLGDKEAANLYRALRRVLRLAITKEGTSARDYRKPDGSEGGYYRIRKAYQKEGERCSRDGAAIERIRIGGRSAHYCPKHQV